MPHLAGPPRERERGAIAVLAAFCLAAIIAFMALSLNVGHMMSNRAEIQSAVDSAALAGAMALNGTAGGLDDAVTAARAFGSQYKLDVDCFQMDGSGDVTLGYWNGARRQFYPDGAGALLADGTAITLDRSAAIMRYYNAVKTHSAADGASGHNGRRPVFFSTFVGTSSSYAVGAGAVAVGGGPCSDPGCTLPLVLPSCALDDGSGAVACGTTQTFYFNYGHGKNIALAAIDPDDHANTHDFIQEATGAQTCGNRDAQVGNDARLDQGNNFTGQVEDAFEPMVCHAASPTDPSCVRREVAVADISNCNAPMNQSHAVAGFVQVVITGTRSSPGPERSIDLYISCGNTVSAPGGCTAFGVGARKLRLVQ